MFLNWSWRSTSSDFDVHQGTIFSPSSSRSEVSRSDMLQMFAHVAWMCCYPMLVKSPSVLIYECAWLNHCLKHGSHMISHCLYPQSEIKCHVYIPSLYIIYIYVFLMVIYHNYIYIYISSIYIRSWSPIDQQSIYWLSYNIMIYYDHIISNEHIVIPFRLLVDEITRPFSTLDGWWGQLVDG